MNKIVKNILGLAAALAAVAAAAYLLYTYWDKLMAKLEELKGLCEAEEADEEAVEEVPAEEAPAEESAPAEQAAPAEETVTEADFAD